MELQGKHAEFATKVFQITMYQHTQNVTDAEVSELINKATERFADANKEYNTMNEEERRVYYGRVTIWALQQRR